MPTSTSSASPFPPRHASLTQPPPRPATGGQETGAGTGITDPGGTHDDGDRSQVHSHATWPARGTVVDPAALSSAADGPPTQQQDTSNTGTADTSFCTAESRSIRAPADPHEVPLPPSVLSDGSNLGQLGGGNRIESTLESVRLTPPTASPAPSSDLERTLLSAIPILVPLHVDPDLFPPPPPNSEIGGHGSRLLPAAWESPVVGTPATWTGWDSPPLARVPFPAATLPNPRATTATPRRRTVQVHVGAAQSERQRSAYGEPLAWGISPTIIGLDLGADFSRLMEQALQDLGHGAAVSHSNHDLVASPAPPLATRYPTDTTLVNVLDGPPGPKDRTPLGPRPTTAADRGGFPTPWSRCPTALRQAAERIRERFPRHRLARVVDKARKAMQDGATAVRDATQRSVQNGATVARDVTQRLRARAQAA
ncbi:hypothetical protein GGF32_008089 [Allomyces javanicus]|nr:hypothetical protein GGF32_008089 [Allomyces javanicus]